MKERRIAAVTGANSGIGLELTKKLLEHDWEVVAVIRSKFPADEGIIENAIKNRQVRIYHADLADYNQLRQVISEVKQNEISLDALFNNAGGSFEKLLFSTQGRELHYELQTIVPFILTNELMELLQRGGRGIVVNTSSDAFKFTKKFLPEELENPKVFKKLIGSYALTKLAVTLWAQASAQQFLNQGITVISIDPGNNNTMRKGRNGGLPLIIRPFIKLFGPHPSVGAGRLFAGINMGSNAAGAYISKGEQKAIKFANEAQKVLEQVDMIYQQEYLQQPS